MNLFFHYILKLFQVDGFPSVFLYKHGKKISEYDGNRSLEDLQDFVVKHLSSHDEL